MKKSRKMKDIHLREISLVDKPANLRPFLLWKQDGKPSDGSLLKAKKKINIEIVSDGTVGGTDIVINGDKVEKMQSFNFSFWKGEDAKSRVSASYTTLVENVDGFQRTETYYLSKGDVQMDKRLQELLKSFLGDGFEKADFELNELNEATIVELEKALTTINGYKDDFPADLVAAVSLLAVPASQGYKQLESVEKAGAKLSKDTTNKIRALVAAAKSLEGMLPKADGDDTEKSDENSSELQKTVEKLAESVLAITGKLEEKEASDEIKKVGDAVAKIADRIKSLEKQPASTKKSLGDAGGDDTNVAKGAGPNGEVLWKSLVGSDVE